MTRHKTSFHASYRRPAVRRRIAVRYASVLSLSLPMAVLATCGTAFAETRAGDSGKIVRTTLNHLEIVFDGRTGSIVSMSCPGIGKVLEVPPAEAGILDLACPVPDFEPLRLASRFSRHVRITKTDGQVTIHWENLGASRAFAKPAGRVSATVTLKAAPDGRSVIMSCRIDNQSDIAVRQVLFPDFLGLLPIAGVAETEFRTGATVMPPFVRLAKPTSDYFYAVNRVFTFYAATRVFTVFPRPDEDDPTVARWFGFGTDKGGFVLFPQRRVRQAPPVVMLHLWERNNKLRIMYGHDVNLTPGQAWQSDAYRLTPFEGTWAKGTEPYRTWVERNRETE